MHELAIARALVGAAERHAGGRPVTVVRVRIGRLRQVVPESLSFYFGLVADGTGCDGAKLEWERVASALRCRDCGAEWDPAPPPAHDSDELVVRFRCPACESADHEVVSGDELTVDSIDVTDPSPAVTG